MTVEEYLSKVIAEPLSHELQLILSLKEVTRNTELLGKHTEALVRNLSRRVVSPLLHVSTGAVIDYPLPDVLRQIDVILWAAHPAPSIYEIGDFGLVPRSSAFGLVEIKRSNYSGVDGELEDFIDAAPDLVYEAQEVDLQGRAMGVISVLEQKPSARLQSLINKKVVVAFFEKGASDVNVRTDDVLRFINFLHRTKRSYQRTAVMGQAIELKTKF